MGRTVRDSKDEARSQRQRELDAKVDTTSFTERVWEEMFRLEELQKATRKRLEVLGVIIRRLVLPASGRGG